MFKLTKGGSGLRRSGGSARTPRVSSTRMGHSRDISTENLRKPAFVPTSPQEQGRDSDSPRLQGLEKSPSGSNH